MHTGRAAEAEPMLRTVADEFPLAKQLLAEIESEQSSALSARAGR